jgi:hypothetical protein
MGRCRPCWLGIRDRRGGTRIGQRGHGQAPAPSRRGGGMYWSHEDELDVGFLERVDDVLALRCGFVGDDGVDLLELAHRREAGDTELR